MGFRVVRGRQGYAVLGVAIFLAVMAVSANMPIWDVFHAAGGFEYVVAPRPAFDYVRLELFDVRVEGMERLYWQCRVANFWRFVRCCTTAAIISLSVVGFLIATRDDDQQTSPPDQ